MAQGVFLAGLFLTTLGAVWEHHRWSRVLVVLGILLMLFTLAPSLALLLFT